MCVFTCEVPDGWWGGGGRILRLADIYKLAWPPKPGMHGQPRETAEQVLAARRRQEGENLLAAAEATWGLTFAGVMRILAAILFAVNLSAQATRAYDENP